MFINNRKGFTLVEMVTAVFVLSIAAIAIINFMIQGHSTTKNLLNKGDNLRDARLAIARLEKDIKGAHGVVQVKDTEEYISFSIVKVTDIVDEESEKKVYITYNFLKKDKKIDGVDVNAGSLTRGEQADKPEEGKLTAQKIIIHSSMDKQNNAIIGLIPEGEYMGTDSQIHKYQSKLTFIDRFYDECSADDETILATLRELMKARHTYKGTFGNAEHGYDDVTQTVAIKLEFAMGDGNRLGTKDGGQKMYQNVEFFQTVAYMRCMFDGNSID